MSKARTNPTTAAPDDEPVDLTRGVYRRVYAGFIKGRRINRVSIGAEAWFWRINAAADDFGNADADPWLCHAATAGRRARDVTPDQVSAWVKELQAAGLVEFYESSGDKYLHVVGFTEMQPSARNGRRMRRFPMNPSESGNGSVPPREIPGNPGESGRSDTDTDTESKKESADADVAGAAKADKPGGPDIPAEPSDPAESPHAADAGKAAAGAAGSGRGAKASTQPRPAKAAGKVTGTGPEHVEFREYFRGRWKARYGADYAWKYGRDDGHAKWVLNQCGRTDEGLAEARRIVDRFADDDDPWLVERRHEIALLVARFNRYQAVTGGHCGGGNGAEKEPGYDPWNPPPVGMDRDRAIALEREAAKYDRE